MAAFKSLSGMVGAGVVNGGVFVGTTDADAAEIVVPGFIPYSAGAALNKGDAIIMNYFGTSGDPQTLRSDWFVVGSISSQTITLQIISGYGGSGLGNPAGFNRKYLSGNIGAGSNSGNGFSLYTYNNGGDDLVTITTAGYFDDVADILKVNDVIYVSCAAGTRGADLLRVSAVTTTTVTVVATDFKQFVAP